MRDSWVETNLDGIADWGSGGTPKADNDEFYGGTIPWCVIGDLTEDDVWETKKTITQLGLSNSSAKIIDPGSVLLAMYGASIGRTGISAIVMATNQAIAYAKCHDSLVLSKYLLLFLQTQKTRFVEMGQGAAQPNISQAIIKSWTISLPPLPEQKRIVDLISSVDSYIEALQQQVESARRSRNAALEKILTNVDDQWRKVSLGDVLEISRGGSPRPIQEFLTDSHEGINWVKIADATRSEKYIRTTLQKIKKEGVSRSREVFSGDFILSNSMSFGRPYIMRTDGCIHDGWLLLAGVDNYFDEDFLYNLLSSDYVQMQFDSLAAGSGVRNLNIEVVKRVKVQIPSKKIQNELSSLINYFDEFLIQSQIQLQTAKVMRRALLSDLLSGNHEIPATYDKIMGAA